MIPLVIVFLLLLATIGSTAIGYEFAGGWTASLLALLAGLMGILGIVAYFLSAVTRVP